MPSALPRSLAAVLLLAPATAFAHTGLGSAHAFADGFAHPLDGLDHMLAMVTVGILAWQFGGRAIWLLPASFLSLMALGGTCGVAGEASPWVELGIAVSVIVLGLMVALGANAPLALAMGVVGLFAIFHGYAHGAAMPFGASGILYAAGFVLATAFLHVTGIALGILIGRIGDSHGRLAYRLGGGAVALAGAGILQHVI
jgi:urease accessory protein